MLVAAWVRNKRERGAVDVCVHAGAACGRRAMNEIRKFLFRYLRISEEKSRGDEENQLGFGLASVYIPGFADDVLFYLNNSQDNNPVTTFPYQTSQSISRL